MSELVSMLVPLQTLAGWPEAPVPSALNVLGLLIGFPALMFVIVFAVAKIGNAAKAARADTVEATDPVWVGGRNSAAIESGAGDSGEVGEDQGPKAVGGAGARW